jgi:hypothetical protein
MLAFWEQNGYRVTHRFCGGKFMRLGVTDSFCEFIVEPVPGTSANEAQPIGAPTAPHAPSAAIPASNEVP